MPYLVKCEISGIQDFIFNVQSKGAAKTLKARSFFIEAVSFLIEALFADKFKKVTRLYTGGGNVFLEIADSAWDEAQFTDTTHAVEKALLPSNLTVAIACLKISADNKNFGELLQKVNYASAIKKLQPSILAGDFFVPYINNHKSQIPFSNFTNAYARHNDYKLEPGSYGEIAVIGNNCITLLGKKLTLTNSTKERILTLPQWNATLLNKYVKVIDDKRNLDDKDYTEPKPGDVIGLEYLAAFAKERTGTDKLGILKLDVDNLGKLFGALQSVAENKRLSDAFKEFFSYKLIELLKAPFPAYQRVIKNGEGIKRGTGDLSYFECEWNKTHYFRDNIYPVFAGGDDCFIVGAWDAVIELAVKLHSDFKDFEKDVRSQKIPKFTDPITLSAAVIVVDAHYPVVRFAEIADNDLDNAKKEVDKTRKDASGSAMKNKISFMGHIFSWQEFEDVITVKNILLEMLIKYDEAKAFIQRIIKAYDVVDNSYWHNCNPPKPFNPALLWQFKYSFRDVRNKPYFNNENIKIENIRYDNIRSGVSFYKIFFSEINGFYKKHLWDRFGEGKKLSQVLPVAARWAELLCREKTV